MTNTADPRTKLVELTMTHAVLDAGRFHGDDPEQLSSTNPATGELLAQFPIDLSAEVVAAVAGARAATKRWVDLGHSGRRRALLRWAKQLLADSDELCELIHAENGKPVDDAFLELSLALELIRWAASHAARLLEPRSVRPGLPMANFAARVEYRPLGIVGVIGPWNYPVYTPTGSIAFALAAGNTVVFKPSEHTTAIGTFLVEAFHEANPDLPKHILSAVVGHGETGAALCSARVDKIAFTGSAETGRKIMATCAKRLTPVLMECGGKDAFIVAEDADIAAAAEAAAFGGFSNAGQTCIGVERIYVVRSIREQFIEALRRELDAVRPGSDASASYGPMTIPSQLEVVRTHIVDALAHGAKPIVGGPQSVRPPYIDPVLLIDADESCAAVREETFGPMITIKVVRDVEEAIELANATAYGLGSTVFSRGHGMEIARQLRAGATSINSVLAFGAIPGLPFGGVGKSGFGRIHGAEGLREFTRTHAIARQRFAVRRTALVTFRRSASSMRLARRITRVRHRRGR